LQQTPSVQVLLPHSEQPPTAQSPPAEPARVSQIPPAETTGRQMLPVAQKKPLRQSPSLLQEPLMHAVPLAQAKLPGHGIVMTPLHTPLAQLCVVIIPFVQEVAPQDAPFGLEQLPIPLQSADWQSSPPAGGHTLCGSLDAGTLLHVPDGAVHCWQPPHCAALISQQT
jgi:hypothetical protein